MNNSYININSSTQETISIQWMTFKAPELLVNKIISRDILDLSAYSEV